MDSAGSSRSEGGSAVAARTTASIRQRPNVLVCGTPGTGKTTLVQRLMLELDAASYTRIDINSLLDSGAVCTEFDAGRHCRILDEDALLDQLEPIFEPSQGGIFIDYHGAEFFVERWFDLVVVLRTDNTALYDRLSERGYSEDKVRENVECEIFGTLLDEALESYDKGIVKELRSDTSADMERNVSWLVQFVNQWSPGMTADQVPDL